MSETACGENVEERTRKITEDMRSRGHRVTPQRVAIVREFVGRCDHPSAEALYKNLADDFPMMAMSTVYNTLSLLSEMGEAVEVSPVNHETRFDPDTGDHCHLTCISCGKITDLPLEACERSSEFVNAAEDAGFEPVRQVYHIFGHCRECRESQGAAE